MTLRKAAVVAGIVGMALLGAAAPANAGEFEDYCSRHPKAPVCPDLDDNGFPLSSIDDDINGYPIGAIPPAVENGTEGQMVPNIDGSLSLPGTPGAI